MNERFKAVWRGLIEPHPSLVAAEDRRGARLLSALILVQMTLVIVFFLALGVVWSRLESRIVWDAAAARIILAGTAMLGVAYAAVRLGWFRSGAAFYVVVAAAVALAVPFAAEGDLGIALLPATIVPALLAAMLFSARWGLAALGGCLLVGWAQLWLAPWPARAKLAGCLVLAIVAVAGALAMVFRQHISALGRERLRQLGESEESLRSFIENSPAAVILVDEDGVVVEWNRAAEHLTGIPSAEALGAPHWDVLLRTMPPDQRTGARRAELQQMIGRALTAGRPAFPGPRELELTRVNGERAVLQQSVFPIKTARGYRMGSVTVDVTERKRAEDALRESEASYRGLVETLPDPIVLYDLEGKLLSANLVAAQMYGAASVEEFLAQVPHINELLDDDGRAKAAANFQRTLATGRSFRNEYSIYRRDRSSFVVDIHSSVVRDAAGRPQAFVSVIRDITERKATEQRLIDSEARFRLLVQNSNDVIVLLDAGATTLYVTEQIERISGFPAAEFVGKSAFHFLHPDDATATAEIFREAVVLPGAVRIVTYRHRHARGGWVQMEGIGCNMLHDPRVAAVVLNVRDITERRRAEEEKRRLEEQLQQAMKMEAVGRLAGGVAHDFNNLLTGILGNVELTLMDAPPDDPVRERLEVIGKAADSAAALTRQLLAFSRKQLIEPKVIDLNELLAEMHKMLERIIGEDIKLAAVPGEQLGSVRVDPGQAQQIIVNLAVNARDAMPHGGVLRIETANVRLDRSFQAAHTDVAPGDFVRLTVTDTGVGMSDEVKRRLFEPFFTTKPKGQGTGLGLATIYGAVKQSGGAIEVDSAVGRGTTVRIYFPRTAEKAGKLERKSERPTLPGGDETVLLVEDEPLVRDLAVGVLKRLGYTVFAAADGAEALTLAEGRSARLDLLLTDVVMPGMNGRQLADRVCALHPETKVLFTSGYTEDAIAQHGVLEAGLQFIGKPYSLQDLAAKVRETLERG